MGEPWEAESCSHAAPESLTSPGRLENKHCLLEFFDKVTPDAKSRPTPHHREAEQTSSRSLVLAALAWRACDIQPTGCADGEQRLGQSFKNTLFVS